MKRWTISGLYRELVPLSCDHITWLEETLNITSVLIQQRQSPKIRENQGWASTMFLWHGTGSTAHPPTQKCTDLLQTPWLFKNCMDEDSREIMATTSQQHYWGPLFRFQTMYNTKGNGNTQRSALFSSSLGRYLLSCCISNRSTFFFIIKRG